LFVLLFTTAFGQGSLRGTVVDAETQRRLEGVNIILEGTSLGTSSDAKGEFLLTNIPAGSYTVVISYVGYAAQSVSAVVEAGKEVTLAVRLVPVAIPIPPVIITAITARERESPVTFSDLKSEHIRSVYMMHDAPSVLSELPSIVQYSWNGNDLGYSFLNIRGFDQRRIAVMVNGVPQNDPEDHNVYWIDMPDLLTYTENVQVQRGAGSAFYGPPAIGGSINIVTTPVRTQPQVSLTSAFGFQYFGDRKETILNTRKYGVSIHSGLVERKYMLYGNLSSIVSSGYRNHSWVDLKSYFIGAARFDETMTTRIHVFGGPLADGLAYTGIPKFYNDDPNLRRINYNFFSLNKTQDTVTFATFRKPQEIENFFQPHYELLHEWKLSRDLTLYNTLFYVQGDGFFDYDGDWVWFDPAATKWFHTYVGYDTNFGSARFNSMVLRGFVGNKQWGWLPRVELRHLQGTLTLGGEFRIHRSIHWGRIPYASVYPDNYDPDFRFYEYNGEKDMLSVFGHEVYRLTDRTTLMADLQLVYNRYGIRNEKFLGNSFSVPYLFVNPRFGVNHNVTENLNGYISVAYTSREPRLRNLYAAEDAWFGATPQFEAVLVGGTPRYNFDKPLAKPERLLNLEIGGGYTSAETRVTANLFWMEFFDELIKSGKVDIFGAPVTGNAERTRHVGLELLAQHRVTEHLEFAGNLTLSRNRLIRYREFDSDRGEFVSYDGNPIAGFPDILGNLRLRYQRDPFMISVLGKHVGSFYTDNTKNVQRKVDAYTVFDLDASYAIESGVLGSTLTLRAKIKNLFNTLYLASGEGKEFFPSAERSYFISFTLDF